MFDDCLPDGWGHLILERYLQRKQIDPAKLTILQRLVLIRSTSRGAFEYWPETRLFEGKYFGVERSDRNPTGKIHTVSAAGLINADYRIPCLDYGDLIQLCHVLTKNMEEVYVLFLLMVFNDAFRNRDNHAKNFSFQLINDHRKLSLAYKLLPGSGFNGLHTTTVNINGDPTTKDIMAVAAKARLSKQLTTEIIQEVETLVNEYRIKL